MIVSAICMYKYRYMHIAIAHCNRIEWVGNPLMCDITHTQMHSSRTMWTVPLTSTQSIACDTKYAVAFRKNGHRVNEPSIWSHDGSVTAIDLDTMLYSWMMQWMEGYLKLNCRNNRPQLRIRKAICLMY